MMRALVAPVFCPSLRPSIACAVRVNPEISLHARHHTTPIVKPCAPTARRGQLADSRRASALPIASRCCRQGDTTAADCIALVTERGANRATHLLSRDDRTSAQRYRCVTDDLTGLAAHLEDIVDHPERSTGLEMPEPDFH